MTAPDPDADTRAETRPAPRTSGSSSTSNGVARGSVVHFEATNQQTGEKFSGIGVVTYAGDGEQLSVRPLADFDLTVDRADVEPITVDG